MLAPASRARSAVRSVEPSSTTSTSASSMRSRRARTTPATVASSFHAGMKTSTRPVLMDGPMLDRSSTAWNIVTSGPGDAALYPLPPAASPTAGAARQPPGAHAAFLQDLLVDAHGLLRGPLPREALEPAQPARDQGAPALVIGEERRHRRGDPPRVAGVDVGGGLAADLRERGRVRGEHGHA